MYNILHLKVEKFLENNVHIIDLTINVYFTLNIHVEYKLLPLIIYSYIYIYIYIYI